MLRKKFTRRFENNGDDEESRDDAHRPIRCARHSFVRESFVQSVAIEAFFHLASR